MNRASIEQYLESGLGRIRRHPFIVKAHELTLSKEQGLRWIMCAGRESQSFVAILANLTRWCEDSKTHSILSENLANEMGDGNPQDAHFMHYLQLLEDLNVPRSDFYLYREGAGIKLALSLAYNISLSKQQVCALGYLLINEAMTPITYGAAKAAILSYYPNLKTSFFDLHVVIDDLHVKKLYEAVDELPASSEQEFLFGIDIGERGMAVLLDEALGVFDHCAEVPATNPSP